MLIIFIVAISVLIGLHKEVNNISSTGNGQQLLLAFGKLSKASFLQDTSQFFLSFELKEDRKCIKFQGGSSY